MNKMIRFLCFLLMVGLVMGSCRSSKKIQSAIAKKDSTVVLVTNDGKADSLSFIHNTTQKLFANHIDYKTFSAKINVDYQGSDGKKYDVNAFVRMSKDSVIWISVNAALGIEAMRVLIKKDSVWLLNKL